MMRASNDVERRAGAGRLVNRYRVEFVVALRAVVDSMAKANGTATAVRAAPIVTEHLNEALTNNADIGEFRVWVGFGAVAGVTTAFNVRLPDSRGSIIFCLWFEEVLDFMKNTEVENQTPERVPENEQLMPVEPATLTPEQLEELKQRAAKADEHWERLLRATADFDNYKKRAVREKQEAIKYANESLLEKLIPVLDTFDMALSATQNGTTEAMQSLQTGITMVHQQLKAALASAGLEEVDATGKVFDPNLHEAVSQQETAEVPEGTVVQQMRKGYKLNGRLLRPASAVVSKLPAPGQPS